MAIFSKSCTLFSRLLWIFCDDSASVRVSNELGAGRPKAARFSVLVVVVVSVVIQSTFALIIFLTRKSFPAIFTEDKLVREEVTRLVPFLCSSLLLASVQPVLSGPFKHIHMKNIHAYIWF